MMLLSKGFFRKKSIKIFAFITIILMTAIITLMSFINYYKGLLNAMLLT